MIKRGDKDIKAAYRGDKAVKAIYRGTALRWQKKSFNSAIKGYLTEGEYCYIVYTWEDNDESYDYVEIEVIPDEHGYFEAELDTAHERVDLSCLFGNISNNGFLSLDLSGLDTSNATSMERMFLSNRLLEELDLSSWDTSKVTSMNLMFNGCYALRSLNLSSFDTSNVEDMAYMFSECSGFSELDLSDLDTSKLTTMEGMFSWCYNLESLNLSSFDTSNVVSMQGMFQNCHALKSLDLSNFDTSNVEEMEGMFGMCLELEELDISNFDFSKAYITEMFYACPNLRSLHFGTGVKEYLDLSDCPLDRDSVTSVIEGLAEVTSTKIVEFSDTVQQSGIDSKLLILAERKGWSIPIGGTVN